MNFADIQNTWHSPHNRPDAGKLEEIKMSFVADLRRRRRGHFAFLVLTFVALAWITGKLVVHALWPGPMSQPVDWAREWGLVPFILLPWAGWLAMWRMNRRHHGRFPDYQRSIAASLRALRDETRLQVKRSKTIAVLLIASVAVLPLVVEQLRNVEKAGAEVVIPAYVIYPAYVVGVLVWMVVRHRRKIAPRQRELEQLLAAYEQRDAG